MKQKILLITVIVAGLCSIVYELLVSSTATYFLGDGVKQFSILIGIYLFSMGVGVFASRFVKSRPLQVLVYVEYLLGFIGGISVPALYFLFINSSSDTFQYFCVLIMFVIGFFTGAEVPLLTYAFKDDDIKDTLANILSLDYIGGLLATILFPFILLPFLGLFYSSLLFGIINVLLGVALNIVFLKGHKKTLIAGLSFILILITLVFYTGRLLQIWDEEIYKNPIVTNIQTPYQKIVVTENNNDDTRLYLNRVIQFSSKDEHRYHEMLVHVPLVHFDDPKRILILGGGENLASREALKHSSIQLIDVVDIDSAMFDLAKNDTRIRSINEGAAHDPRVRLINQDAFTFLYKNTEKYDVIIADLPDPSNESLARLYSRQFFLLTKRNLNPNGIFVTQSGEIYFSNSVFSCIKNTVESVYKNTKIYHVYIPSFGDWGFTIASDSDLGMTKSELPEGLKYLTTRSMLNAFGMPNDIKIQNTEINTLDYPIILNYFLDDWETWKSDFAKGTMQ